jgi:conjugal transfer pilus assembly protein TraW
MAINVVMKKILVTGIILNAIIVATPSFAKDLGVFGQTYTIQEVDFLDFIKARLIQMQKNGEWNRLQNQFRANVTKHADRPHPVESILKTVEQKTWKYDPSITVPYDLHDADGRVFAKAGTTVNPLRVITLHNSLLFFDADDKDQVVWAEKMNKEFSGHTKLILIKREG